MKKLIEKIKNDDGFTLLEMSIVIMVVAALLLLIIPNVSNVNNQTSKTTNEAAIGSVDAQILLYKMENPDDNLEGEALLTKLVSEKYITEAQRRAYESKK